jgi:hypothetical protein
MADTFDWSSLIGPAASAGTQLYANNQARNSISDGLGAQQQYASAAQGNLQPYAQLGATAIQGLQNMQSPNYDLTKLPGYSSGLAQGEQGINRALAARGQYGSGGAGKELAKYNQDYANTQYGNEWNRLGTLLNSGQNASNAISGINQNLGNSAGAAAIQRGNSSANTTLGIGTTLANYLGGSSSNGLGAATGNLLSSAGNGASSLWNNYFNQGNGYNADGSMYGSTYTGSGNTIGSLIGAGGFNGSGGTDYWSGYTPTNTSQDQSYLDYMNSLDQ